jgi:hypothetical protein
VNNGSAWVPKGGVAAVAVDDKHVEVFTVDKYGYLWSANRWDYDHWTNTTFRFDLPLQIQGGSQIAAMMYNGAAEIYYIGNDSKLHGVSMVWSWVADTDGLVDAWGPPTFINITPQDGAVFQPTSLQTDPCAAGPCSASPKGGGIAAAHRTGVLRDTFAIGYDSHAWTAGWYGPPPPYDPSPVYWPVVATADGLTLPIDAIAGGTDFNGGALGGTLYPCRADINGTTQLGKSDGSGCWIPYGGGEYYTSSFEVAALNPNVLGYAWVPGSSSSPLPPGAVQGGQDGPNPLYVCQARVPVPSPNSFPGTLLGGSCNNSFFGREYFNNSGYYVLTVN